MAISIQQKVDYLLKKLGYSSSKTGIAEDSSISGTKKAPFAEALPSPLIISNNGLWFESGLIPVTPPTTDLIIIPDDWRYPSYKLIEVYGQTNAFRMTEDNTVGGRRSFIARSVYGDNSSINVINWIDTQYGPDYIVEVYAGDPNAGGIKLSAGGSGSNDEWFFDYSSGVLNFSGNNVPGLISGGSDVYIKGWRYVGGIGALTDFDGGSY
jgi:hypothetical protein